MSVDDPICTKLIKFIPRNLLEIDGPSYELLIKLKEYFQIYQKKITIITYILAHLSEKNWVQALLAIQYYRHSISQLK